MQEKATALSNILQSNKIKAYCIEHSDDKNSEFYDIALLPGGRINDVKRYVDELCLALKTAIASLSVIAERGVLRLEIVKTNRTTLDLFKYGASVPPNPSKMSCLIGQTLYGQPLWLDIADAPHVLIAGTTGSGKSTVIHSIVANLLGKSDVQVLLLDPKGIEFGTYDGLSNTTVSYDYSTSILLLRLLYGEMNARYERLKNNDRDFPYIALIVDEFADLISQDYSKEFYTILRNLAQKSRAAGIHIVLSTQRPSVDIVDGAIKANFPVRIACKVATMTDSRVIIDQAGAERLFGRGDAIVKTMTDITRFQATHTTAQEVKDYFAETGMNDGST